MLLPLNLLQPAFIDSPPSLPVHADQLSFVLEYLSVFDLIYYVYLAASKDVRLQCLKRIAIICGGNTEGKNSN